MSSEYPSTSTVARGAPQGNLESSVFSSQFIVDRQLASRHSDNVTAIGSVSVVHNAAETRKIISAKYSIAGRLKTPGNIASSTSSRGRTPATASTSTTSASSFVVVALVEGRGKAKGEIGIAYIDLRTPVLTLSQFADTSSYARLLIKLQILNPVEIIVPDSSLDRAGNMTALADLIHGHVPSSAVTRAPRRCFNDAGGLETIRRLGERNVKTLEKEIVNKYYCLSCAFALVTYVERVQNMIYAPASLRIVYEGLDKTCFIDASTARNLELIVSLKDVLDTKNSVYGILNRTSTFAGARMMRSNILQPSFDVGLITSRLDAIDELTCSETVFFNLKRLIGQMLDIEHLVGTCVQEERNGTVRTADYRIGQMIILKHTLELVEPLRNNLGNFECELFKEIYKVLGDPQFGEVIGVIYSVIHEDVQSVKGPLNSQLQKCFAVRQNVHGLLDVARRTYNELMNDVTDLCEQFCKESELEFTLAYSASRGFYLKLYVPDDRAMPSVMPDNILQLSRRNNSLTCSTRCLIMLNDRLKEVTSEILVMSNVIVTELIRKIRVHVGCIYNLCEVIANLDFIVSLADASSVGDYVRPMFSEVMAVKAGRHPVVERIMKEPFVANDVYASVESNIILLTGPNMTGKSTFLKQVALIQIMAQMGCYVPAEFASIRLAGQILSRIGHNDDLETNKSSFVVEMTDLSYMLESAQADSLIIIDELARNTATEEGLSLCYAVIEHLVSLKAFVFFATHFVDLAHLDGIYPNLENFHFSNQLMDGEKLSYALSHVLEKGPYRGPLYGFEIVEVSSVPREVYEAAKALISERNAEQQLSDQQKALFTKKRAAFRLQSKLRQAAKFQSVDSTAMRNYLKCLREEYCAECGD